MLSPNSSPSSHAFAVYNRKQSVPIPQVTTPTPIEDLKSSGKARNFHRRRNTVALLQAASGIYQNNKEDSPASQRYRLPPITSRDAYNDPETSGGGTMLEAQQRKRSNEMSASTLPPFVKSPFGGFTQAELMNRILKTRK